MISMIYRATDWLRYKKTMADGVEDEFEALWRHRAAETEDEVMLRLQEIAGLLLESCRLIVEQPVRFQVSIFLFKGVSPPFGKDFMRKPTGLKQPHSFRFVEDVIVLQGIWCPFWGGRNMFSTLLGQSSPFFDPSPISYQTLQAKHEPRNLNSSTFLKPLLEAQTLNVWSCMVYLPTLSVLEDVFSVFWGGCSRVHFAFSTCFFLFPPLCEPGIMESHIVRSTDFHSFILHHFR